MQPTLEIFVLILYFISSKLNHSQMANTKFKDIQNVGIFTFHLINFNEYSVAILCILSCHFSFHIILKVSSQFTSYKLFLHILILHHSLLKK
jgi:hypothetical protein